MLSNLQTWTVIALAGLIWLGLALVGVVRDGIDGALDISNLLPFLLLGFAAFERWGWRWSRLHPHVVGTPVVTGTWRGTLTSLWTDPATRARPEPKTVYLAVRQTLSTVSVRLLTDESTSRQMAGAVTRTPDGDWVIAYTYGAVPKLPFRATSPQHLGAAHLAIIGEPAARLEGEYWTSRGSLGTLTFETRVDGYAPAHPEAAALFEPRA